MDVLSTTNNNWVCDSKFNEVEKVTLLAWKYSKDVITFLVYTISLSWHRFFFGRDLLPLSAIFHFFFHLLIQTWTPFQAKTFWRNSNRYSDVTVLPNFSIELVRLEYGWFIKSYGYHLLLTLTYYYYYYYYISIISFINNNMNECSI